MIYRHAKMGVAAICFMASVAVSAVPPATKAQDPSDKAAALQWIKGPAKPAITERAQISLPSGIRYLDPKNTDEFLKLTGNLPEQNSYTVAANDLHWFSIFAFNDMGYVKDDEAIDADSLLKTLRENQESANVERKAQGLEPLTIVGWAVAPHYDKISHNLEYGLTLQAPAGRNVNYTTRILGRAGVMTADLITSPETLDADLVEFRKTMAGFAYVPEQSYAAYKEGDKVSEYGLAALVTGGAAAALAKGGLLKGFFALLAGGWKIIAVAIAAGFATFRNFLSRLFRRGEDIDPPSADDGPSGE